MESLKEKELIIFDLDGTIIASGDGVISCFQKMQKELGMKVWDKEDLIFAIGPPIAETFLKEFAIPKDELEHAFEVYRKYYKEIIIDERLLFDGISDMLADLKSKGKILAIATSKIEENAIKNLEDMGVIQYFDLIGGHRDDIKRDTKGKVLQYVVDCLTEKTGLSKDKAVLIGDRKFDIIGAKEVGITVVSVEYGYGDREEFLAHNTDFILPTVKSISEVF